MIKMYLPLASIVLNQGDAVKHSVCWEASICITQSVLTYFSEPGTPLLYVRGNWPE